MSSSQLKPISTYSGLFDQEKVPLNKVLQHVAIGCIQPDRVFSMRYQVVPCTMSVTAPRNQSNNYSSYARYLHLPSIIRLLVEEEKRDPNTFLGNMIYDPEEKLTYNSDVYVDMDDYLAIYMSGGSIIAQDMENPLKLKADTSDNKFICINSIIAYCIPQTAERARKIINRLLEFKLFIPSETCLLMVCHNQSAGFYTSNIIVKQPMIKDLRLNYGDAFLNVHEKLIEQLKKPGTSGITFLHGPPGTGKTYYIRYLINEIKEKSLIYVPPDLVNEITKPGFLPFLMQYPDSILIIEDAENIILDRKETVNPNQAVSNLLNLSDGLIGDAMRLQIITTFNCEIKAIDPALLREGRLIVEHKFEKLSIEDSRRLYAEMNISGAEEINQPMALAEIYAKKNSEK